MLRAFWLLPINKKHPYRNIAAGPCRPYTQCFEHPCGRKDACAPTTDRKRSLRDATRAHGERMRTYGRSVSLPLLVPRNENNVGAHPILMRAIAGAQSAPAGRSRKARKAVSYTHIRIRGYVHNHTCAYETYSGLTDTVIGFAYVYRTRNTKTCA